ncbi:hypothetical protein [uncultured Brevundimonas sp.]|uniref:hypothetical protein n=1 Tax=uncultured Brevundimonas sp. TaxID=213418 RepID=UPI0025F7BEFF|nr:hypothetical protein [uncultured Brevundimonas sp.]
MLLATANLAAAAVTLLYTVPANRRAVLCVNLCNRSNASVSVRVALTSGVAPTDADWIEYETPLPAAGNPSGSVLERTGLALGPGQKLYVRASASGISASAFGIEDAA